MVLVVGFMRPLLVWRGYWIDEGYVMSGFKGTPGPWVVDLYGVEARWNIDATNGDSVAITNQLARDNDRAIRDANTSLIAAAPELLEALMSMVSRIEYYATLADADKPNIEDWAYTYNSTDMDVARQAIKKALGN
ncbi:hypothetical protein [Serratia ureilytica]|uniref:hypothetical protein n=1 Tax=Serratia ureilytica TaxID=300181 RepID=UPI00191F16BB|nr:hypothetical protein [Serratia ureilytica]QQU64007.1 hypothetical protein I6I46_04240 [Serratia ureilytica]